MRIGILSDSHGRFEMTRRALAVLKSRGANLFLHLGDICDTRVLEELIGFNCHVVFGNCDDITEMKRYAEVLGIAVDHPLGTMDVAGKRIAFTHGDNPGIVAKSLAEGVDYLFHGHTHEIRDERIGRTRIINPGALHRASRYTVGLLEPAEDRLEFIEISRAE